MQTEPFLALAITLRYTHTYRPQDEGEKRALYAVTSQVAEALGVPAMTVPAPKALITMVDADGGCKWMRDREREDDGMRRVCVNVSVRDSTPSMEFRPSDPPPSNSNELEPGTASVFDARTTHRFPCGDFRRVISFDIELPGAD